MGPHSHYKDRVLLPLVLRHFQVDFSVLIAQAQIPSIQCALGLANFKQEGTSYWNFGILITSKFIELLEGPSHMIRKMTESPGPRTSTRWHPLLLEKQYSPTRWSKSRTLDCYFSEVLGYLCLCHGSALTYEPQRILNQIPNSLLPIPSLSSLVILFKACGAILVCY